MSAIHPPPPLAKSAPSLAPSANGAAELRHSQTFSPMPKPDIGESCAGRGEPHFRLLRQQAPFGRLKLGVGQCARVLQVGELLQLISQRNRWWRRR